MSRDAIKDHFEFFGELGVDGVRREPEWSTRATPDMAPGASRANLDGSRDEPQGLAPQDSGAPVIIFASQGEALDALRAEIGHACTRCKLHTLGRRQVVFGVGNPNADLMFVGEAPGADEDVQGE